MVIFGAFIFGVILSFWGTRALYSWEIAATRRACERLLKDSIPILEEYGYEFMSRQAVQAVKKLRLL